MTGHAPPPHRPGKGPRPEPVTLDPGSDRFARVVHPSGLVVSQGTAVPDGFPLPDPSSTPASVQGGDEDWRTITRSLPGGSTLQVAATLEPLQDDARRLQLVVLAALAGALLLTALLTRTLTRIALGPLERLRGTAGEVAATADLDKRVPVGEGPEEIDALAGDLNAMLARLGVAADGQRQALESARRFAADAGHELRTPLTSLRGESRDGAVGPAREDARRLTALVEQLQALARGEAGPPARPEQRRPGGARRRRDPRPEPPSSRGQRDARRAGLRPGGARRAGEPADAARQPARERGAPRARRRARCG